MELHNPRNLNLPPLMTDKTSERRAMEGDLTVRGFIHSNLLLDSRFNRLYVDLAHKSHELLSYLRLSEEELFEQPLLDLVVRLKDRPKNAISRRILQMQLLGSAITSLKKDKSMTQSQSKGLEAAMSHMRPHTYKAICERASALSRKVQDGISLFEASAGLDLSILTSTILYTCRKCSKVVSFGRFKPCTCTCGEKVSSTSRVRQRPIHHFNDRLINFVRNNFWLEHGVDYVLRRKNLGTLVGQLVLGHSGAWHEIDNIAYSKKRKCRFFGECKHSQVNEGEIFIFAGKMADVGCTRGYIFTTSEGVPERIGRLARSKNIDVVTGVLKRDVKDLLSDIKEG